MSDRTVTFSMAPK